MGRGVKVGLKNIHYSTLTTDTIDTIEYEAPVKIAGAITANINPNSSIDTLHADDNPFETAATTGQIELELNVADLPLAVQAALLGHTLAAGRMKRSNSATPPYVAIGFESLKSNGSKKFIWLYKGKFSEPENNSQTKGESVEFQTPTITGSFVAREHDGFWIDEADEDEENYVPSAGGWYTADVLEGTDTPEAG